MSRMNESCGIFKKKKTPARDRIPQMTSAPLMSFGNETEFAVEQLAAVLQCAYSKVSNVSNTCVHEFICVCLRTYIYILVYTRMSICTFIYV